MTGKTDMKTPIFLKRTLYVGALCVPFAVFANEKTQSIEIIDLDKITITERGQQQTVERTQQQAGEKTVRRVVSEKHTMSEADLKKYKSQSEKLVTDSHRMVKKLKSFVFYPELKQNLDMAYAVFIFPSVLKVSILFGGGGGYGVLLVKQADGTWSYPSFYNMNQAGFGLQIGASKSSTITIIQNKKALENILDSMFKIEASMEAAVGDTGDGQGFSLSRSVRTYSMNKGASIGVGVDGETLEQAYNLTQAYYGASGATTQTVVFDALFTNSQADDLRGALSEL